MHLDIPGAPREAGTAQTITVTPQETTRFTPGDIISRAFTRFDADADTMAIAPGCEFLALHQRQVVV
jgi:hypothetical protein